MAIGNVTPTNAKTRYWWAVLYPENMVPNWESELDDLIQLPHCYCIHDKDLLKDGDEQRKVHVHMIICFSNTTTYRNALNVFQRLSTPGQKCCNKCEAIINVRYAYDYLIHNTKKCKESGKHLYAESERKSGCNFDIGSYEQLSTSEIDEIFQEIRHFVLDGKLENFIDLDVIVNSLDDSRYSHVLRGHRGYFAEMTRGMYLKRKAFEEKELFSAEMRKVNIRRGKDFAKQLEEELSDEGRKIIKGRKQEQIGDTTE